MSINAQCENLGIHPSHLWGQNAYNKCAGRVAPKGADECGHSRACGMKIHEHGRDCAKDCPTCAQHGVVLCPRTGGHLAHSWNSYIDMPLVCPGVPVRMGSLPGIPCQHLHSTKVIDLVDPVSCSFDAGMQFTITKTHMECKDCHQEWDFVDHDKTEPAKQEAMTKEELISKLYHLIDHGNTWFTVTDSSIAGTHRRRSFILAQDVLDLVIEAAKEDK